MFVVADLSTQCVSTDLPLRIVGGLSVGSIYALIALGYTLVYGVLRLINFAHSEVFMAGTFGGLITLNALTHHGANHGAAWMLVIALVPGVIFSSVIALGLERFAYRPLRRRGATRLSFLISAIGASLFLQSVALVIRGRSNEFFPDTIPFKKVFKIGKYAQVSNHDIIVFVTMIAMFLGLYWLVNRTRTGKGIRAVAQDAETASLMGVNIDGVIVATFLIGGALAGVAAILFGLRFNTRFDIGFLPGIKAFTAAVLGGIGNITGALIGGLTLGIVENVGAGCFGDQWTNVIAFTVLVGVLLIRPSGILGESLGKEKA